MKQNLVKAGALRRNITVRGPLMIVSLWSWIIVLVIITNVDPSTLQNVFVPNLFVPLLLVLFIALSSSLWVISRSKKLSLLWSSALIVYLVLRLYQMGHLLNALLLFAVAVCAHIVIVIEQKQSR